VHEKPSFYEGLSVEKAEAVLGAFYPLWDGAAFLQLAKEFELPLGRKIKTFSHGMRTRFTLAAALSHGAELLLLDEPSSGLDPAFRRDLLHRLSGVIESGSASVLFSTHITSDLDRIADYVTLLRDGEVEFSSTKDEVLERHALVKGDPRLLEGGVRGLLKGVVIGDFGFVGLTDRVEEVREIVGKEKLVVDPATLEDIVYYTGRTGEGGLRLHGHRA
jgi:ABC-2 type transport system ATP-binding protein